MIATSQPRHTARSPHLKILTWCGAVLGCSVLVTPWLGLHGLGFHLVYGFLYSVYSILFTCAIWQAGRAGCTSRLVARIGRGPALAFFGVLSAATLVYWSLALLQWLSNGAVRIFPT